MMTDKNKRYESGRVVAASSHITKVSPRAWRVQSQAWIDEFYIVVEKPDGDLKCSCPDYFHREEICKHIWGVILKEVT